MRGSFANSGKELNTNKC